MVVVAYGGEHEAGAGSGGGDGEHAQLVVAGVAHAFGVAADAGGRHRLLALPRLLFCLPGALAEARIAQVHKVAGAQQGAAHGGIGPGAFLQTAYIYGAPGLTGGECGGENLDRVLADAAGGEGVHGQVLRVDEVEELLGTGAAHLLVKAVGGFEETDHGVEVSVGGISVGACAARLGDPGLFEAAGFPERPEHFGTGGFGARECFTSGGEHGCDAVHGASYALFGEGFGV